MRKFLKIFKRILIGIFLIALVFLGYFFSIRFLDKSALEMKDFYVPDYDTSKPTLLPSQFIDGERFYLKIPASVGDTLLAFADSGGGISMLLPAAVEKKHLQSKVKLGIFKGMVPTKYILFSDLSIDTSIPPPFPLRQFIIRRPFAGIGKPFLLVPPEEGEVKLFAQYMPGADIFLGQNFFMGKAWTIDYTRQQVWVNTPLRSSDEGKPGVQKIGLKKNSNQEAIFGHPSLFIEVDGEKIDVLFDTGATMLLSDNARKRMNTHAKTIAGSFIAASVFDKWRITHPEWKYFAEADANNDAIEVPVLKIGGIEIGPVLFSRRADENWSQGMIQSMDKVVKGAIGGSALKYLKVTIDYNSGLIKFEH